MPGSWRWRGPFWATRAGGPIFATGSPHAESSGAKIAANLAIHRRVATFKLRLTVTLRIVHTEGAEEGAGMARHRFNRGLTFSRARHRAPGRAQRVAEHGLHSVIVAVAAAMLVMAMVGSDPVANART